MPWVPFKFPYSPSVEILVVAGLRLMAKDVTANCQMRSWSSATKDENCGNVVMVVMVVDGELVWEILSSPSNFSTVKPSKVDLVAGS